MLNFNHLRIFHAVARHRSYTKAGHELRISQSAVSHQIKDLENYLDLDLFEKLGKQIHLTTSGYILEEYAQRIFSLAEEAQKALEEVKGLKRGSLRIGASTTPGIYVLPAILGDFQRRYPQIELSLEIANTKQIERMVKRNEIDLGIVGRRVNSQEVKVEPYLEDQLVLILSPNHLLAKKETIPIHCLVGERFILREKGSATREVWEKALEETHLRMEKPMELGSTEAIKRAVEAGLGVSVVSKYACTSEVASRRLVMRPFLERSLTRQFQIIYHKDKRFSGTTKAFLEILRNTDGGNP